MLHTDPLDSRRNRQPCGGTADAVNVRICGPRSSPAQRSRTLKHVKDVLPTSLKFSTCNMYQINRMGQCGDNVYLGIDTQYPPFICVFKPQLTMSMDVLRRLKRSTATSPFASGFASCSPFFHMVSGGVRGVLCINEVHVREPSMRTALLPSGSLLIAITCTCT